MGIPESQLETWSHQGSIQGSSATYNSIRNILTAANTPYAQKGYSVFLQGSYGNDTNIYSESDVDIVICLNDCFHSDRSALTPEDENAWRASFNNAAYKDADFKRDVFSVLSGRLGADVSVGGKAIQIAANGGRRKVDVIVAIQFRRYHKFKNLNDQEFDEGICFYTSSGEQVVNYPRQHRENMTAKHQNSSNWLKPMVRVMKNARSKLVQEGMLAEVAAPSYFIEGLLHNIPNENFHTNYETTFVNVLNWLLRLTPAQKNELLCANHQYYLIRDGAKNCWTDAHYQAFLNAIVRLWNNW